MDKGNRGPFEGVFWSCQRKIRCSTIRREVYTMPEVAQSAVNAEKLNAFVGRMLGDLGALTNSVLVHLGDQLGLYKALSKSGPVTSAALAKQTGTSARLLREWLSAQAAQGYVTYDKLTDEFSLSPE